MEIHVTTPSDNYEIIIVGGGPAGCAAAIAAAQEGARVLLLESTTALGGMGTMGLVPTWCPFSDKEKIIYQGLAQRIFFKSRATAPQEWRERIDWVPINAEALKRIYDDEVCDSGAQVRFGSLVCAAQRDADRITCILVADKSGLTEFRAQYFIDCTGDGDVCAMAGLPFEKGPANEVQASTLCFALANCNTDLYVKSDFHSSNPNSPIHKIIASGRFPLLHSHINPDVMCDGLINFNAGHLDGVDSTDPVSVSENLPKGRKIAEEYCRALSEFSPEIFGNAYVAYTAPLLGIRESRRVVGEYTLTEEDYRARRSFPDEIARNAYYLDVHLTKEQRAQLTDEQVQAKECRYNAGESHGIPLRCLIPRGMDNILVAGRAISADRAVMGSVRVMPNCLTTGEAAGTAAAMALHEGCGIQSLSPDALRARLRERGAYFL